ncbi:hypothetical protein IX317_001645 [Fusobacterium sp. DD29]|uniref:hypothetical protein n=1 Tax=unclassified Fusobacterium TaxID=2648384 RepID=UPI001B8BA20E|nr:MULTISPECIES: hypothetical protein [unclassified Fusobacterium]MBR8749965.1 hypothetical protein [Fusobacterium sp. DD29]MBR8762222.1 hypothetical protein [Fusobacterium sp. DD25]MBR8768224.1 hypothetical protein [Fusobacterium sp. DD43]MBR8772300.1 hypothetical protein [Fusobacterium sp. DD40]MBR8776519.1 hypothetical protein [Fusobacterium sp. DD17]
MKSIKAMKENLMAGNFELVPLNRGKELFIACSNKIPQRFEAIIENAQGDVIKRVETEDIDELFEKLKIKKS